MKDNLELNFTPPLNYQTPVGYPNLIKRKD